MALWQRACSIGAVVLTIGGTAHGVELTTERASGDRLLDRVVRDDADLVVLASSEHRGQVGPCGCEARPLGGLQRAHDYAEAVRGTGVPTLVVHAGGWLDTTADEGRITSAAKRSNEAFTRGLRQVQVDVLNVGFGDLAALELARPGLVSANLRSDAAVLQGTVREVGEHRVALTGVSRRGPTYLLPEGATHRAAVPAAREVLERLDGALSVVLVYDDPQAAVDLADQPWVDLVIEAAGYKARWPAVEGAHGGVRVRTWDQGVRLTELRLWLGDDGELQRVLHREVDLD
jgi:hypothetical protein